MAIESADDLAVFFDADDFGTEVVAVVDGASLTFTAILTDANDPLSPGIKPSITTATPRLICKRSDASQLRRDCPVTIGGKGYLVKVVEHRGAISTVILKES